MTTLPLIEMKPWNCRYCGLDQRVDSLASQYVQKLGMIIKRSTHELDLDDQASVKMWVERNKKSVFFYQDSTESDPFILGIQTEWQLQQMIRFGNQSLLACDSSFGISKLKVFCVLCLAEECSEKNLLQGFAWLLWDHAVFGITNSRLNCWNSKVQ